MLTEIRAALATHAQAAGFRLTDAVLGGERAWLTYCAEVAGEPVLLELFDLPADGRLVAELWCPARLPEGLRRGSADAAMRRRVWHYPPEAERRDVARAIAEELKGWLAGSPREGCAPQDRAARPEQRG
jgi:hypothetical protein